MRVIIAGSRDLNKIEYVRKAVGLFIQKSDKSITEIVSGTARGVDRLGEDWANEHGIPIKRFPANWDRYGKQAGYLRNKQMAEYGGALIAIWDGESPGTGMMINLAREHGLLVLVYKPISNSFFYATSQ